MHTLLLLPVGAKKHDKNHTVFKSIQLAQSIEVFW